MLWKKVMPRPVRRPRAVRRHPPGRRARARADRVPLGVVLGPRGPASTRAAFERPARRGRRRARRHGQGLRPTPAQLTPRRRGRTSTRRRRELAGRRRSQAAPFTVRSRRGEALPPLARRAVHDLDAAAGGQPQAALVARSARCASRSGSTRTATSPTCVPTRRRCRSRRSPRARARPRELYGAEHVPDGAAQLRPQGQERAGGPRGDPPGGRRVPHARRGRRRAARRRVRALRPDLEAHRRLADGRRPGPRPSRSASAPTAADGRDAEFSASGTVITFRGFLAAYEEVATTTPTATAATDTERRLPHAHGRRRRSPRSTLDAEGHATKPPPRYTEATLVKALEERGIGRPSTYASIIGTIVDRGYVLKRGQRARADLPRVRRGAAAGGALRRRSSTTTSPRGMEEVLDAIAGGDADRVGVLDALLLRRPAAPAATSAGLHPLVNDLGEIDAREHQLVPDRATRDVVLRVGRYGPYVERDGRAASGSSGAQRPRGPRARRAHRGEGRELLAQPSGDRALGDRPGDRPARSSRRPAATAPTSPRCCPTTRAEVGQAAHRRRCSRPWRSTRSTLDDALRLLSLPRVVGVDPPTASRSPRRTAATART